MSIGGCASFPGMEGGIVGTGNRIDCPNEDKSRDCERPAR
jgi:hypothetical protein